jgi:predicted metal-dependent hydrolase
VESSRSIVTFGGTQIAYSIRRSSRRSTVSIAIDPTEGVLVTAPRPASLERLDRIVHAKAPWIIDRLKRRSDLPPPMPAREFVSGETFLHLGRQHRLRLDLNEEPRPMRLESGWFCLPVPCTFPEEHRGRFVRAALIDWYKRRASRCLPQRMQHWSAKLHIDEPELLLVESRKRWGSASASGTVRINWRIIQAPLSLVDYVVLHELVHLRHPNHTHHFWGAIGRVMPDYEGRKARLRALGPRLEW